MFGRFPDQKGKPPAQDRVGVFRSHGASRPMLSGGTAEGPVRAKENAIILRLARARYRYTGLLHPGAELLGSYPRMFHAGLPNPASLIE